jgi:hypothetical protein
MTDEHPRKQNLTISLSPETVRKGRIWAAARHSTSISGLLAAQIETLIGAEEAWERSERSALALLESAFIWADYHPERSA